jgi:hypothetical protein
LYDKSFINPGSKDVKPEWDEAEEEDASNILGKLKEEEKVEEDNIDDGALLIGQKKMNVKKVATIVHD